MCPAVVTNVTNPMMLSHERADVKEDAGAITLLVITRRVATGMATRTAFSRPSATKSPKSLR